MKRLTAHGQYAPTVLREFGVELADNVNVQVWTAHLNFVTWCFQTRGHGRLGRRTTDGHRFS